MLLVTVVLLMTAMLVESAAPAMARPTICPCCGPEGCWGGTPVPAVVCKEAADTSPFIGWRNGTCWVFHPTPQSFSF
jgi:hypothetical protein